MNEYLTIQNLILFVGIMAFLVSVVTEVIKDLPFLKKVPTNLTCIVVSMILCPAALVVLLLYEKMVIEWYYVFAAMIAAFIVALVSMDGWERITDLSDRMIRK